MIGKKFRFQSYDFTSTETIKKIENNIVFFESGTTTTLEDLFSDNWTELEPNLERAVKP